MSVEALPQEVVFDLPSSLVPHRTYEFRSNPSNANSFTTEGATIQFTLPRLERSFYQANTIYVRGRLALTIVGTAGADLAAPPLSFTSAGAYSLFSRQVVRTGSGQAIETINNPAIVTNIQMAYGLTPAERVGMNNLVKCAPVSSTWGGNMSSAGWGLLVNSVAGHNASLDFSIPLNSILTNCEKFLPAGFDEFVIELTIGNLQSAAGAANAPIQNPTFIIHNDDVGVTGFSLTDLEISAQVFELSPPTYNQLMAQYPAGMSLKSQSCVYGSSTLAGNSVGTIDIPYTARLQSIKQFIMAVSPASAIEGPLYSGVNPNLNSFNLSINGQSYPTRPVRATNPSETYAQNMKSFGALMSDLKSGSIAAEHHAICSSIGYGNTNFQDAFRVFSTGAGGQALRQLSVLATRSNRCFFLLDLESINGGKPVYNGVSTSGSGSSSIVRLEIGSAISNTPHSVHMFSIYDALLKFDPVLGVSVVN